MTWIIVNFIADNSNFQQYDVDMRPVRSRSWIRSALETASYLSYVPPTWGLVKFLLKAND